MTDRQQPEALRLAWGQRPMSAHQEATVTLLIQAQSENERLRAELEALRNQEPVAWMNVRNGFICKKPTNADYQQPLYLAAGAQPEPSVPDVDSIVDLMSEFATHDIERGQMEFDKWTLREAVEAALAAAPEAPKSRPLTDAMVEAAGRALSDRHANGCGCGMDKDIMWSSYSDEFKEQARVALGAAHGIKENSND